MLISLAANFVAVPLIGWGIGGLLSLDEGLSIGLTLMATAAGAPFLPKLAAAANGSAAFSVGLMVLLMVVTVAYMPLVLPALIDGVEVDPWAIASSLIFLMLLPLAIGLAVRARYEDMASGLQPLTTQISSIAIAALLVAGVIVNFDDIVDLIGTGGFAAIVLFLATLVRDRLPRRRQRSRDPLGARARNRTAQPVGRTRRRRSELQRHARRAHVHHRRRHRRTRAPHACRRRDRPSDRRRLIASGVEHPTPARRIGASARDVAPVASLTVTRVLSCIQPTGDVHLGNYLGALRNWVAGQHEKEVFHGIVDLHALTITEEPGVLGENTLELAAMLFAVGLDPEVATVFVQSHVPEHPQLGWVMECTLSFGELSRMTQFKDKTAKREGNFISAGLFSYPALQAADIVLYDTNEVPVGDDQRQHVEITRDAAIRFNHRFGDTLVVPEAVTPAAGARVMDLQDPTSKMSKSLGGAGCIMMLDDPAAIMKKFKRAVTDSESEVRYDVAAKPGVSGLLDILAAATGTTPHAAAEGYTQYGPLKSDTGEAVAAMLAPIQARYHELIGDRAELTRLLQIGSGRARTVASATLTRVYDAIGLVPA